ncbi:MAG: SOS response-associated peptidase family protein [Rhodobacteraceae bacterium]|nr:SOS response-associated peptidase family protein [Paracoccaceae bacterium]
MCNLYSNLTTQEAMAQLFEARPPARPENTRSRAVFPRHRATIIVESEFGRELSDAHWGFLMPRKSKRTGQPIMPNAVTNARDDKIRTSGFWRDSFRNRRCLVPATAYCEPTGRRPATYHWFGVLGPGRVIAPFAFAGIWQRCQGEYQGGNGLNCFAIATTAPNQLAARFHNRMPVILRPGSYGEWLNGGEESAAALLRPLEDGHLALLAQGVGMTRHPETGSD